MKSQKRRYLHFHLDTHSRRKRKSAARALAYVLRDSFINPRTGTRHDFSRSEKLPPLATGSAGWSEGAEEFAVAAAFAEKRKDAVEAREITAALPNELSEVDAGDLVDFLAELIARIYRVAVIWALHPPETGGDQPNLHAHLVFTTRRVLNGRLREKTREWDEHRTGSLALKALRIVWGEILNERLRELGQNDNVELRSFAEVGDDRVPTKHHGERKTAMLRRQKRPPLPTPQVALRPPLPTPAAFTANQQTPSRGSSR